jgi:Tfp pilus assembly protein PilW
MEEIMHIRSILLVSGAALALTACTEVPSEPIVTSFNEASVGIQIQQSTFAVMTPEAEAKAVEKADAKAQDVCGRGPNRRAERTSSRQVPAGEYMIATEYLYLCLR